MIPQHLTYDDMQILYTVLIRWEIQQTDIAHRLLLDQVRNDMVYIIGRKLYDQKTKYLLKFSATHSAAFIQLFNGYIISQDVYVTVLINKIIGHIDKRSKMVKYLPKTKG